MVSDYTPPPVTQATLKGAPCITVSPVGLAQGYPKNNNANYGPDTPGTTTCGIQEAINTGRVNIELLDYPGYDFNTSTSILLPATYGIRLIGHAQPWNGPGQTNSCINYSGTGYAIDTQPGGSSNYNVHGWMDGILVIARNGGGINFNEVIYSGGYLAAVGGGVANMNCINFYAPSFGPECNWGQIRIGTFANAISVTMDHLTIEHLSTAYTTQNVPVILINNGYTMTIKYWHHFFSGTVAPNYLLQIAGAAVCGVLIENQLLEQDTYAYPTVALFGCSVTPDAVPIIRVLNQTVASSSLGFPGGPTDAQLTDFPGLVDAYPALSSSAPASSTAVQNGLLHEYRAVSWNTSTLAKVLQTASIQLMAGASGNPPVGPVLRYSSGGINLDLIFNNAGGLGNGTIRADTAKNLNLSAGTGGTVYLGVDSGGTPVIISHLLTGYNGLGLSDNGISVIRGSSLRTALTATDASPITAYAVPTTTGFFRISLTILGRSGTITSGVATLKYTVGGVVITETVSITAVSTEAHISPMVQPDASTNITVQLTTLTGTSPSVDVACLVEGVSSGT